MWPHFNMFFRSYRRHIISTFYQKLFWLYLEEEFSALFHDLLDLQEAGSIHEEKLVPHRHTEPACVTESQNLLEALGLHSRWKFHYSWARLIVASTSTVAAENVSEIRTARSQHSSMGLGQTQISKPNIYLFMDLIWFPKICCPSVSWSQFSCFIFCLSVWVMDFFIHFICFPAFVSHFCWAMLNF